MPTGMYANGSSWSGMYAEDFSWSGQWLHILLIPEKKSRFHSLSSILERITASSFRRHALMMTTGAMRTSTAGKLGNKGAGGNDRLWANTYESSKTSDGKEGDNSNRNN